MPEAERAHKHVVLNENVGFELLVRDEGGGPFTWVARERVFVDGRVEHMGPGAGGAANGGLQGL